MNNSFIENIPQLNTGLEAKIDNQNYCSKCKNSDEIESVEYLSHHMMNDHDPQEFLPLLVGQNLIEERRQSYPF